MESAAFNGALLLAAWRFSSNSSRGQAHARRLFLVSLAYLPVFFGCLLLHQKREPQVVVVEDDMRDAGWTTPVRERLVERGRELCIHENLTGNVSSEVQSQNEPAQTSVPATSAPKLGCPVVVAEQAISRAAQVTSAKPHPEM